MNVLAFNQLKNKHIPKICALLMLFSTLLYANTLWNSYNLDDTLVTRNHKLTSKGIKAIPEIFKSPYYEDSQGYSYEYRPIVLASFAIEHSFSENPSLSHFINSLIFGFSSILLFLLLIKLFPNINILLPLLTTLLFIAHPIHTEAVASIKNRDELLALLGGLCSLYFSILFVQKRNWFFLIAVVLSFLFGILSKMSVISFVLIIPIALLFFTRVNFKQLLSINIPLILASVYAIPFNEVSQRVLFATVLFITPILIYAYLSKPIRNKILNNWNTLCRWMIMPISLGKHSIVPLLEDNASSSLLFPNKAINRFLFLILLLPSLFLFTIGIVYSSSIVAVCSTFPLLFIFWYGDKSARLIAIVLMIIFLALTSYFFNSTLILEFIAPIIALGFFFSKEKREKYIYAFFIFLFIMFAARDFMPAFIFIAFIKFFKINKQHKRKFLAFIIISSTIIISLSVVNIIGNESLQDLASLLNLFLILLFAYLGISIDKIKRVSGLFIPIALLINVLFFLKQDVQNKTENIAPPLNNYIETIDKKPSAPFSPQSYFSTDRPIDFVEMPLQPDASWDKKIGTSLYVLGEYIKLAVLPHPMGFYYGYAHIKPVGFKNINVILSILLHIVLIIIALYLFFKRKQLIISFGIIFYLSSITLFSNIFYPVVGMMADRFLYIASVGFCLLLAYFLLKVFKIDLSRDSTIILKPYFFSICLFILSAYSIKTIARNSLWKDPLTLMEHDIKHLDKSAQAHNLLANFSMQEYSKSTNIQEQQKYINQGIKHFEKAIEIYPKFFNAYYDLGRANMAKENYKEAVYAFKKVLEIDSTFTNAMVLINNIYEENNMIAQTIPYYEKLIRHAKKGNFQFYNSLAYAWFRLGNYDKAIEVNQRALREHPNSFDALSNLGKTYLQMGNEAAAMDNFEMAFKIQENKEIASLLAQFYERNNNIKKANYYKSFLLQ